MKKRILALLITLICIMNTAAFSVSAEKQDIREYEILKTLGIVNFDEDFNIEEGIYVEDFLVLLVNSLGYNFAQFNEEATGIAAEKGITSGTEKFGSFIKYDAAVEMARSVLEAAVYGDSGIAREMLDFDELTEKISNKGSQFISCENAMKLILNMNTAPLYVITEYADTKARYTKDEDTTLLTRYRDIHIVEGMVNETRNTSMYDKGSLLKNDVRIEDTVYSSEIDLTDLFGVNITAFVRVSINNDETIIYAEPKLNKNKFLTIQSEQLMRWENNNSRLVYGENDRKKSVNVSRAAKFIYNGVVLISYTSDILIPKDGHIELVDNNNDKTYDIVKITSYEYILVDVVRNSDKTITNKYTYGGALESISFDFSEPQRCIEITKNGEQIDFTDIKEWDILRVAKSREADPHVIKADVSDVQITASADEYLADDGEVTLNGKVYTLSKAFITALEKSDKLARKPSTLDEFTYYIASDGRVAAVYGDILSSNQYGWITKLRYNEEEETVFAEIFTEDGVFKKYYFAEKMRYNNVSKKRNEVYDELCPGGTVSRQLLCYSLNSDGELKKIYTAKETAQTAYDGFSKAPQMTYKWRINGKCFDSQVFLKGTPKIFVIPEDEDNAQAAEYFLASTSDFSTDAEYTFSAYNLDEFSMSELFVMNLSKKSNTLIIVDKLVQELNSDDEAETKICGKIGSYSNFSVPIADTLTSIADYYDSEASYPISSLERGDILLAAFRGDGKIIELKRLYTISQGKPPHTTYENITKLTSFSQWTELNSYDVASRYTAATCRKTDKENNLVLLDYTFDFGTRLQSIKVLSGASYSVFDANTNESYSGTFSDIEPGDYLFMKVHASAANDVVIIKNV
ncbi:MAG: hypothetical protein J6C82_03375 [Clostridia bacterium]|nr:hypothetical protein [Clostridia bacterium]MBP3360086.1 hypothetical protein [Clostridia bacterium]